MNEQVREKTFKEEYEKIKEILEKSEEEKTFMGYEILQLGFRNMKSKHIEGEERHIIDSKSFYMKEYGKKQIWVTHESRDRSKTFMPRPDGNKVDLIVKEEGKEISKETFNWRDKAMLWEYDE